MATVRIERWGEVPYEDALTRQLALHAARIAGEGPDTIVDVSHPPTITLGRHAPETDVTADAGFLAGHGVHVCRTDRGGRATAHGPGQAVVYPIVGIADRRIGVSAWVCLLERAIMRALASFGIDGTTKEGSPGIWTARGKIASLGLRVSHGVSYHGISINACLDAGPFDYILPCGVPGERIATVASELANGDRAEQYSASKSHADKPLIDTELRDRVALAVCEEIVRGLDG